MELLRHYPFTRGTETHTFTVIGRCPHTGRLGIATTTSEIGVGGRVPAVKPHVGAVATQAYTDPRLGSLALQLLDLGYPAARVLAELEASDPHIEWRQLGLVDRWGHTAVRTGSRNTAWAGHLTGDGWVVMGNALVGAGVVEAMAQVMRTSPQEELEVRLIRAIEAGTAAGGQPGGQRSAAILVYENAGFAIINLRIDDHVAPVQELRRLFDAFYPLKPYYQTRPDNPTIGRVADWARERGIVL